MAGNVMVKLELVQALTRTYEKFLRACGQSSSDALVKAARTVVYALYYEGDDGWEQLKEAIGQLEQLVGRPKTYKDI